MKTLLKMLPMLLALPVAAAIGCNNNTPAPVNLDGVVSADSHGKGDLTGELYNCQTSCTCASGATAVINYASCAAIDLEAANDVSLACDRYCAVVQYESLPAQSWGSTSCQPAHAVCDYAPVRYGSTDLASSYPDGGYDYPVDFGNDYPIDLASQSPDLGL